MMSTPRWLVAVAVLGSAAAWLWSETRVSAHLEVASAPTAKRDRGPQIDYPRPSFTVTTPAPRAVPAASNDAFVETGVQLRARFAKEGTDAEWANPTRTQLEGELGKLAGKDANLRSIDCRTSMCRVEVAVASTDAGATFVQSWLRERTFTGPGYVTQGDGTMVMFVGKPGTDLVTE